jgi:hypothetical protein
MSLLAKVLRYIVFGALTLAVYDRGIDAWFIAVYQSAASLVSRPCEYRLTAELAEVYRQRPENPDYNQPTGDRLVAHQVAAEHLTNLVLFKDGRGMHSTPALARFFELIGNDVGWKQNLMRGWFSTRAGVIFDQSSRIVGFKLTEYRGVPVVAQGCAVCHVGKVLGQIVPGLGNKNIDPHALASIGQWQGADECDASYDDDPAQQLAADAAHFRNRVTDDRFSNLTQGMVAVATIQVWFYEQVNEPPPAEMSPAVVKVPAFWGYGEKRKVGQFCDGFGEGMAIGWPAMVELVAGQQPDTVRSYSDVLRRTEELMGDLLPPAYPLNIDVRKALRGKLLFEQNCSNCHGAYEKDENRLPIYQAPIHVPISLVQTDDDRLKNITPEFFAVAARSSLADVIRCLPNYQPGYFAPRLEGIWARFPYLHNGSVPTIADLLLPPDQRPQVFDLRRAGEVERFAPERLGLTVADRASDEERELRKLAEAGRRYVYFTQRPGHSNVGHEFGTDLCDDGKRDLIEYLKTL